MIRSIWTVVTAIVLSLFAIFNGIALMGFGPSAGPAAAVFGLYLYATLAVVVWMETRWGALLVVAIGLLIFVSELTSAALYVYPEYGTQMEQFLYAPTTLIVPLFGFLSYWSIKKRD